MNKKIVLLIMLVIVSLVIACTPGGDNPNINQEENITIVPIITISESGTFSLKDCQDRKLEGKAIMIESKFCGHCQSTKPLFLQACQESGIVPEILDISKKEEQEKMISYSVEVQYTPTFIIGCDYYIGAMSKEEYKSALQG
jgi:thiol-disulfide isomerase/thioredoxin